jgi:predicted Zn-dependent protease
MKSGNCRKSLQYLDEARKWPERLGAGKPYEDDVDERVEDWLSYKCLVKNNAAAAAQTLDKINKYTSAQRTKRVHVADIISAWALMRSGKSGEAQKYLAELAEAHPSNPIAKWALDFSKGKVENVPDEVRNDETYQFLEAAGALNP